MEANGGWLPLRDLFFDIAKNPAIRKWPELYLDQRKIKTFTFYGLVGGDFFKGASDPAKLMEEFKRDFVDSMEESDFVTPTDDEIERCKSEFSSYDEDTQTELAKHAALLSLGSIALVLNYLALMVHGRTMCQLVADAMGCDDDAYRRAVQIDRTVLYLPYFQDRMIRAQFGSEGPFLEAVGNSLKRPILSSRIRHRTLWMTFAMLEDEGLLAGLSHDRLLDICEQIGVYGKAHGVEDVGHLRKRLRDYRRYQRTSNIF